jgi:hypothetical protein
MVCRVLAFDQLLENANNVAGIDAHDKKADGNTARGSVAEQDRPRGHYLVDVAEVASIIGLTVINILALVAGAYGPNGSMAAFIGLTAWIYVFGLTTLRLALSYTRQRILYLWGHTALIYTCQWLFTTAIFRSAIIRPRSRLVQILAVVEFSLSSLVFIIAITRNLCKSLWQGYFRFQRLAGWTLSSGKAIKRLLRLQNYLTTVYSCTADASCREIFTSSKNWRSHDSAQYYYHECWLCTEPTSGSTPCLQVFYTSSAYKSYLVQYKRLNKDYDIEAYHLGCNASGRFWCGFCKVIIALTGPKSEAWPERWRYLEEHFRSASCSDTGYMCYTTSE